MKRTLIFAALFVVSVFVEPARYVAAEDGQTAVDFAREVQPTFARRCYKCHGPGADEGGLRLHSRETILAELDSGEFAVVPGQADASAILHRTTSTDDERMPPEGKPLTEKEVAAIRRWIEQGAEWGQHWAFEKPTRPAEPAVQNSAWVRNPIDAFILKRLEAAGLQPAPPAGKVALLRRAYYDLIGLPPTPGEVDVFLADKSDKAFEKVVDRLLRSPHYGEKWARHWLDLVRYAESNGYERDGAKPFAWRYRDYVIRSLNDDKPYDQFIREQIAGDELDEVTPESIIATGYYRLGLWQDEPVDPQQELFEDLDDIARTTGEVFLGITIGCARCHEHKLDPIPQRDYYRFVAFYRNIRRYGVRNQNTVMAASVRDIEAPDKSPEQVKLIAEHEHKLEGVERELEKIEALVRDKFAGVDKEDFVFETNRVAVVKKYIGQGLNEDQFQKYQTLTRQRNELRNNPPRGRVKALCVKEHGRNVPPTHVLTRGNVHAPGEQVEPGFPSVLSAREAKIVPPADGINSSGRRLALAEWLASADNPMTARVMTNRIWQFHFGRGIVRSSSDFGYQGTPPTHPDLLDWLAVEFVDRGWSLKSMHKLIMMSNTYQMSSHSDAAALAKDPTNDLFWRFDMRRLTAEEIRDSILTAGGTLNPKMFGPHTFPPLPQEILATASRPGAGWGKSSPEEAARRSIYIHVKRSMRHPMLVGFDAPDTDTSCAVRVSTTVPTQALSMLNSRFMSEQAGILAKRLEADRPGDLAAQVSHAIRLTTGRMPEQREVKADVEFVEDLMTEEKLSPQDALRNYCLVMLNANELIYLE